MPEWTAGERVTADKLNETVLSAGGTFSSFIVAGTLRSTGGSPNSWEVLDDGVHVPTGGLAFVSVTSTQINISFDEAAQIHTFVVTPDETLGGLGWSAGASVGLSTAVIKIGLNGALINPTTVSSTSANLWIYGLLST